MKAQVFDVVSRERLLPFEIVSVEDFELSERGAVDSQEILVDPNISLYCLEPESKQAIFVKTPEETALHEAPFYYLRQFERATQVLKVPYDIFERLAGQVELDDRRLVLIYSMGRSGTTLTSSAFSQAVEVVSLSEPDVFTQLVRMRDFSGGNDSEIEPLTRACLLLTCKDRVDDRQPVWVIKFRSFVVEIADLIYTHFPQAKSLYLYRNAIAWGKSMLRAFGGDEYPTQEQVVGFWMWSNMVLSKIAGYKLASLEGISGGLLVGLTWVSCQESCLDRLEAGQPLLPVRFEDLRADPDQVIGRIFDYCGVQVADRNGLLEVLNRDSQAKTPISRNQLKKADLELSQSDREIIQQVIAEQPIINSPEYQLPGTLKLTKSVS
jgi:hypothetical protein